MVTREGSKGSNGSAVTWQGCFSLLFPLQILLLSLWRPSLFGLSNKVPASSPFNGELILLPNNRTHIVLVCRTLVHLQIGFLPSTRKPPTLNRAQRRK